MAINEEESDPKCCFCGLYEVIVNMVGYIGNAFFCSHATYLETRISIMGLQNSGKSTIVKDIEKFGITYKGDDDVNDGIQSMPTLKTVISNIRVYKRVIVEYPKYSHDVNSRKKSKKRSLKGKKSLQSLRSLRDRDEEQLPPPVTEESPLLGLENDVNPDDTVINLRITDLSGQHHQRYQWEPYFSHQFTDCILFAIDLSDVLTLETARQTLVALFKHNQDHERLPVLIVAIRSPPKWTSVRFWQWLAVPKEQLVECDREVVFYNREKEKTVFLLKWICGFHI